MSRNTECPLCQESSPEQLIWESKQFRIILANESAYPGFVRVVWNEHVAEMSDLTQGDRQLLLEVVNLVEEVLRDVMKPKKINLAALGNMVPHIHWHVIPRYEDDASFPGSVWSEKFKQTPQNILLQRFEKESIVKQRLQQLLQLRTDS